MQVLITGAAGFLGRECSKQFKDKGYQIISTDKAGVVDLIGDLADKTFVETLPDVHVIVNCAAVQYVSKDLPLLYRQRFFKKNNIDTARNLSERYKSASTHFIHVGTSMMYKQTGQAYYDSHSEKSGSGVYSLSKLQAQTFIDQIPNAATVIPCIIGGEGREGLFRGFVSLMKKYGIVLFPGRGDHKIHMVHVVDVASLIVQIASVHASGFYNAAAPEPLSIRQWIAEIKDELGIKRVIPLAIPLLPVKWLSQLLAYRLLASEQLLMLKLPHVLTIDESLAIGWQPQFSNARIARDIAAHINRGG